MANVRKITDGYHRMAFFERVEDRKHIPKNMTFRSQMRSDWDERARSDAIKYIGDEDEDLEAFYKRGSRLVASNFAPVLKQLGFDPAGRRVLDIGCGMGRLFPGLENLGFQEIWGLDVSAEMITRAE